MMEWEFLVVELQLILLAVCLIVLLILEVPKRIFRASATNYDELQVNDNENYEEIPIDIVEPFSRNFSPEGGGDNVSVETLRGMEI